MRWGPPETHLLLPNVPRATFTPAGLSTSLIPSHPKSPAPAVGEETQDAPPAPRSFLSPLHHTAEGSGMTRQCSPEPGWQALKVGELLPEGCRSAAVRGQGHTHTKASTVALLGHRDAEAWAPHSKAEGASLAVTAGRCPAPPWRSWGSGGVCRAAPSSAEVAPGSRGGREWRAQKAHLILITSGASPEGPSASQVLSGCLEPSGRQA